METILFTLLIVAVLAIIAFFIACLEMTFQLYMQPNMILYPYSVFLSWFTEKGEVYRHLARPFGRCRYCNGTWIMIYSLVYLTKFGLFPQFKIVPTIIILGLGVGIMAFFLMLLGSTVFKGVDPVTMTDKERNMTRYNIATVDEGVIMVYTPWQAMMKAYVVLGIFYGLIYIVIPYLSII